MAIMSFMLITLALIFYSIGVWSERIARYLKPWHVIAFWTGFLFDVSGTLAMHRLAKGPFRPARAAHPHRTDSPVAHACARLVGHPGGPPGERGGADRLSPIQSHRVAGLAGSLLRGNGHGDAPIGEVKGDSSHCPHSLSRDWEDRGSPRRPRPSSIHAWSDRQR